MERIPNRIEPKPCTEPILSKIRLTQIESKLTNNLIDPMSTQTLNDSKSNPKRPEILLTRCRPEPNHIRTNSTQKQMAQIQTNLNLTLTRLDSNAIQFKRYVVHANRLSSTYTIVPVFKSTNAIVELTSHHFSLGPINQHKIVFEPHDMKRILYYNFVNQLLFEFYW